MPTKGTFTTLQQLRPDNVDFGKIAKDQELLEFKYREEARKDQVIQAAKQTKIAEGFKEDYKSLVNVVTGNKTIDEAFYRGVNSAADMMHSLHKEVERNPSLANSAEYKYKRANLNKFASNLKLVSQRYTDYATKLSKGMVEGSLSQWNKRDLADMDSIFKQANLDVQVDPKTGIPIAVTAELDEKGNPTGQLRRLPLVKVLDGRGLNEAVATYDFLKEVPELANKLSKRTVKTSQGATTTITQKFSDVEPELRANLQGLLGDSEDPSDMAKSIWTDTMGQEPKILTDSDLQRIEDFYVGYARTFYDERDETTTNLSAQTSAKREARLSKEKDEKRGLGLQVRTDEEGNPLEVSPKGVYGDIGGGAVSFTLPKTISLPNKTKIDNLYLTKAGKIVYEGRKLRGKLSGEVIDFGDVESGRISEEIVEEVIGGGLNTSQLNNIARDLGYKNAGELKKALQEASGQNNKQSDLRSKYKY